MIKVIVKGVPKKGRPITVTCNECLSTLEFLPSDAVQISGTKNESFFRIKCPICDGLVLKEIL